jgi:hypothetical protein
MRISVFLFTQSKDGGYSMNIREKCKDWIYHVYINFCFWFYDHSGVIRDIAWLEHLRKQKTNEAKKRD